MKRSLEINPWLRISDLQGGDLSCLQGKGHSTHRPAAAAVWRWGKELGAGCPRPDQPFTLGDAPLPHRSQPEASKGAI